MTEPVNLRTMKVIAEGEVNSLSDFMRHHRAKRTRGEAWFIQQEQILQHRRQVVKMINDEISRRQESEAA
ncbi:hypothetical protein ACI0FM_14760 [Paenochrobactrum sp. BZR 588]|uniref:hypothetical protein n=1 Tax=Paenochrobactrum TaxID=999488 RepID=UPI0035BBD1B2